MSDEQTENTRPPGGWAIAQPAVVTVSSAVVLLSLAVSRNGEQVWGVRWWADWVMTLVWAAVLGVHLEKTAVLAVRRWLRPWLAQRRRDEDLD